MKDVKGLEFELDTNSAESVVEFDADTIILPEKCKIKIGKLVISFDVEK